MAEVRAARPRAAAFGAALALLLLLLVLARRAAVMLRSRRTCEIPALSAAQLAHAVSGWSDEAVGPGTGPRLVEVRASPGLPPEVSRGLTRLVEHIRAASSGCASGTRFALSCPDQADYLGYELAVVAESVRRASVLRANGRLCRTTFLAMPAFASVRNTPGAMLESEDCWQLQARRQLDGLGISTVRALSFPLKTGPNAVFNASFLELLFAFALSRPCAAEVERVCGVRLAERTFEIDKLKHAAVAAAAQPVGGQQAAAKQGQGEARAKAAAALLAHMPPPRVAQFFLTNRQGERLGHGANLLPHLECDLHSSSLPVLEKQYARARTLIPLSLPFAPRGHGAPPVLNVVVYVRTGAGSKLVPAAAFIPLLTLLTSACTSAADAARAGGTGGGSVRAVHVHVFTDYASDKCCAELVRWAAATPSVSLFVNTDAYRLLQYHALWSADVLVTSWSKMPRGIGLLSPSIRLLVDGSPNSARGQRAGRATIFNWVPCPLPVHDAAPDCSRQQPTVGLDHHGGQAQSEKLRSLVRDMCATTSWMRVANNTRRRGTGAGGAAANGSRFSLGSS